MVQNGQINPKVYDNSVRIWGGTIDGNTVTLRSGVGISQDGQTLFYFAGNYLSMSAMASAMLSAGAYQAMQLDINNYYVLFTNFEFQNGQLTAVPLLPKVMVDNVGRFLESYSRDFFYHGQGMIPEIYWLINFVDRGDLWIRISLKSQFAFI